MRVRSIASRAAIVVLALTFVFGLLNYWPAGEGGRTAAGGRWTCSMHPQIDLPKPGQCPICGMDLIPVSSSSADRERLEKTAGVLVQPVRARDAWKEIRTVGRIDYDERSVAWIAARIMGRVDRVYADFTGLEVKKGDHLVDIYSPDLYASERELLLALEACEKERRAGAESPSSSLLLEGARTKLLLWGILPEQIRELERTRKPGTHVTIYAPIGGVVIEKSIRAGQYVKEGDALYRIAELDPIWLYLNVYEYDLAWIRRGQKVDVTVEAYPGEAFVGTVAFVDPFLDDPTRSVKVRVNLANPGRRLKPAMYATATVRVAVSADGRPASVGLEGKFACPMHPELAQATPGACPRCGMALEEIRPEPPPARAGAGDVAAASSSVLTVPVSAVLDTGRRRIAYRRAPGGAYELVELELGPRVEALDDAGVRSSYFVVAKGLAPGDAVVVRGGFLLDSQRQIEGMPSLFSPEGREAAVHAGHGAAHGGH